MEEVHGACMRKSDCGRLDHKCMAWDGTGIDFPNFVIVLVNVLFVTKLHHITVQRQQIRVLLFNVGPKIFIKLSYICHKTVIKLSFA